MTLLRLIQIPSGSLLITLFVFFVHSPITVPSNDELVLISKKSWIFSEDLVVLSVYPIEKVRNALLYLLVGLEHEWIMTVHSVGNVIIPTDFNSVIFQRGRLKPPTRLSWFSSSFWEFLRNPGYVLYLVGVQPSCGPSRFQATPGLKTLQSLSGSIAGSVTPLPEARDMGAMGCLGPVEEEKVSHMMLNV